MLVKEATLRYLSVRLLVGITGGTWHTTFCKVTLPVTKKCMAT